VSERKNGTVVCPGSYDPVTNGHVDIITRTSHVFDRVVVGVVNNPVRKAKTLFTAEERKAFIEAATADLPNVEVQIFANLLVREHVCDRLAPLQLPLVHRREGDGDLRRRRF
jgi:pantetheine-phosphate adenylyltransferase